MEGIICDNQEQEVSRDVSIGEKHQQFAATKDVDKSLMIKEGPSNVDNDSSDSDSSTSEVGCILDGEEKYMGSIFDFEEMMTKFHPSKFKANCWIALAHKEPAREPANSNARNDVPGLLSEWTWHLESGHTVSFPLLRDLAIRHQVLHGKWMIFRKTGPHVDLAWDIIGRAHHQGKLGSFTKVSTPTESKSHVICVYNDDFTDKNSVYELESKLRNLGIHCRMKYKPDVFTYCIIYSQNKWGMKPFIYTSTYDVMTRKSVIVKDYDYDYSGDDNNNSTGNDQVKVQPKHHGELKDECQLMGEGQLKKGDNLEEVSQLNDRKSNLEYEGYLEDECQHEGD
ncbi:uncharacterized protein [Antedon mediterranea]|uniref:uncharacterized protein n=1 Tax=Antedon mediterranea TaxID=105859 RepID=UPI003AF7B3A4